MIFQERGLAGLRAPEFPDDLVWFNSEPLKLKDLKKAVVLVDFWTYSCINCLRTLPYLKAWHERYQDYGLIIVGVHSPEFEFEKNPENIKRALQEFEITYPVVSDANHQIWNLYHNTFWPRKLLVDSKGYIVYDHVGEGAYEEIEQAIQKELNKIAFEPIQFPEPTHDKGVGGICYPATPEYYLGSSRGFYGNHASVSGEFSDNVPHKSDTVYLRGAWQLEPEYVEHTKKTASLEDYVLLVFKGVEVNLVMGTKDGSEALVELRYNNEPLEQAILGADVIVQEERTWVKVKQHKMYNLIDSLKYLEGELKILVTQAEFQAYAFTFGGCPKAT